MINFQRKLYCYLKKDETANLTRYFDVGNNGSIKRNELDRLAKLYTEVNFSEP